MRLEVERGKLFLNNCIQHKNEIMLATATSLLSKLFQQNLYAMAKVTTMRVVPPCLSLSCFMMV